MGNAIKAAKMATVIGVLQLPADVHVIYLSDGTQILVDAPELADVLRDRPCVPFANEMTC